MSRDASTGAPPSDPAPDGSPSSGDPSAPAVGLLHCDGALEALSARLDGEALPCDPQALDAHLAGCEACRATEARLAVLHRSLRIRPAEAVPDLAAGIVAKVAPPTPARTFARASLVLAAVALTLVSLPVLLTDPGPHAHDSRHFAVYDLGLAAGFAYVAFRPWVARTLLPLALGLGALMFVAASVDTILGGSGSLGDLHHVLQFGGLALIWALSRPAGHGWQARRRVVRRHPVARAARPRAGAPEITRRTPVVLGR